MATSPYGGFADLSPYRAAVEQRKAAATPEGQLAMAIQEAVLAKNQQALLASDPNSQENQLALAIQRANLEKLQRPQVFQSGNNLFIEDQADPTGFRILAGPKTAQASPSQFVGFSKGKPIQYTPGLGMSEAPSSVDVSGSLDPKTLAPMRKQVLLENEKTGVVSFEVLAEGESIPEGFRQKTPAVSDIRNVDSFRKEVASNGVVKQFRDVNSSKQKIDAAIEESKSTNNFVVVDQVLISTFNRLLEPDSVTMVSEYARTTADAPIINRIKANIARITDGGRLGPDERAALLRMTERIYDKSLSNYSSTIDFFQDTAIRRGWDPRDIFQPLTGNEVKNPPTIVNPSAPSVAPTPQVTQGRAGKVVITAPDGTSGYWDANKPIPAGYK